LEGVSVLNDDALSVIERYDDPETVFYLDPPYLGKENLYTESVNHLDLARHLSSIEGYALVSYTELPEGYGDWTVLERKAAHNAGGTGKEVTERLACNFEPSTQPEWAPAGQTRLTAWEGSA